MRPENRYLVWLCASAVLLLSAVGATNFLVDPYGTFGITVLGRMSAIKPDFVESLRMTRVYAVARKKPRCILLGTSRTGRGLDPGSAALSGLDCYNMALPSLAMYEARRYFQHAQAIRPLERVILALDPRVFATHIDTTGAFSEDRLAVDADGRPQFNLFSAKLPDLASTLLSLQATQSSAKTIRRHGWAGDSLAPDGFWIKVVDRYDYQAAFAAYMRDTITVFADMREGDELVAGSLGEFQKLLRAAAASKVDVLILFSPSHAYHWQALELAGLWRQFEDVKRNVVRISYEEASRAGRPPFPVWDFSGAYGPNLEPVPTSSNGQMNWYWESVHYKAELGNLMVDRMLRGLVSPDYPSFGVQLSPDNIELHLVNLRAHQQQYAAQHPDVVAAIKAIMGQAGLRWVCERCGGYRKSMLIGRRRFVIAATTVMAFGLGMLTDRVLRRLRAQVSNEQDRFPMARRVFHGRDPKQRRPYKAKGHLSRCPAGSQAASAGQLARLGRGFRIARLARPSCIRSRVELHSPGFSWPQPWNRQLSKRKGGR